MKKRIIIAIICIAIALLLCFVLAPFISAKSSGNMTVIRAKEYIKAGQMIKEEDIETISVGKYNLPQSIITNKDDIIGKYAKSDIYKSDYFYSEKLILTKLSKDNIFSSLGSNERYAYSINVQNMSYGVGNSLEYGDIVSIIVNENGNSYIPKDLSSLMIISLKTNQGEDAEISKGTYSCVTFLCSSSQAQALSEYSQRGNISLMLVCKPDSENYSKYVKE